MRSFLQDHFYGFGALLDFLGDQIFFVAANLAKHVLFQIAAHFLGLHAQAHADGCVGVRRCLDAPTPALRRDRPSLTLDQVLAWGDAYHAENGHWPRRISGPIAGAPGERWVNIDQALRVGVRGLPSGLTLARLFAGRPVPLRGLPGDMDRSRSA